MKFLAGMLFTVLIIALTFVVSDKVKIELNNPLKVYRETGSVVKTVVVSNTNELGDLVQSSIEEAYYEGQKDYAEGDIRIRDVKYNHCFTWVSSPWDGANLDSVKYHPPCDSIK